LRTCAHEIVFDLYRGHVFENNFYWPFRDHDPSLFFLFAVGRTTTDRQREERCAKNGLKKYAKRGSQCAWHKVFHELECLSTVYDDGLPGDPGAQVTHEESNNLTDFLRFSIATKRNFGQRGFV